MGARLIAPAETLENQLIVESRVKAEKSKKEKEINEDKKEAYKPEDRIEDYTVISGIQLWDLFDRKKLCFCSQ